MTRPTVYGVGPVTDRAKHTVAFSKPWQNTSLSCLVIEIRTQIYNEKSEMKGKVAAMSLRTLRLSGSILRLFPGHLLGTGVEGLAFADVRDTGATGSDIYALTYLEVCAFMTERKTARRSRAVLRKLRSTEAPIELATVLQDLRAILGPLLTNP